MGQAESKSKRFLTKGPSYTEDSQLSKQAHAQDLSSVSYSEEDEVNFILDDDLAPHSRWKASKELSALIGATRKQLS